jgi:hypothetical protein
MQTQEECHKDTQDRQTYHQCNLTYHHRLDQVDPEPIAGDHHKYLEEAMEAGTVEHKGDMAADTADLAETEVEEDQVEADQVDMAVDLAADMGDHHLPQDRAEADMVEPTDMEVDMAAEDRQDHHTEADQEAEDHQDQDQVHLEEATADHHQGQDQADTEAEVEAEDHHHHHQCTLEDLREATDEATITRRNSPSKTTPTTRTQQTLLHGSKIRAT